MKKARILTLVFLVLVAQVKALSWSGPGHAAVAAMAYRELADDPALRKNLVNLLKNHPFFNSWRKEYNATKNNFPAGLDFGMFLFIRAATWPDQIRRTDDPELKPFDHPNWHFVDYPLRPPTFETGPSPFPEDDVLFGLKESLKSLADRDGDKVERAAMLSWLIHMLGDIHQPLHCAALITDQFPPPLGDKGGNDFLIYQNASQKKSKETTKLHSFWDSRLGSALMPDPIQALADAQFLETKHSRASLSEMSAGDNAEQWSFESRDRAINDGYQFKDKRLKQKAVLPTGYITNSHKVARRRLALAGYRLSDEMRKVAF
ncbi:MAG TPA: S1/P1 nuclease [Pyrinomonadaceae bacterium]